MSRILYIILGGTFILLVIATIWRFGLNQNAPANTIDPEAVFFPSSTNVTTTNPVEIKENFNVFVTSSSSSDVSTNFSGNGELVSLSEFYTAVDAGIDERVVSLLDEYAWQIYRCAETGGQNNYPPIVVAMQYKFQPDYQGDLYKDQFAGLKSWEATLLRDVQSIVFPGTLDTSRPVQISRFSPNTAYPYLNLQEAEVNFGSGTVEYIRYIKIGDDLFVGSNLNCLLRVQEQVFDTGA
jgi:hypothetical protein